MEATRVVPAHNNQVSARCAAALGLFQPALHLLALHPVPLHSSCSTSLPCKRYWVRPSDVLYVKTQILKHVPILIFGESDLEVVKVCTTSTILT